MPSAIAGLETFSLGDDDAELETKSDNLDVSDADSFFNLPDDAEGDGDDK
jgi:hypothetical protein